jgi:hypothetical protein
MTEAPAVTKKKDKDPSPKPKKNGPRIWPWIEIQAEWIVSDPVLYPTKEKFFAALHPSIPPRSWKEPTVGWTELRDTYRQKIADGVINKHRKRTEDYINRHINMGGIAAAAAFADLLEEVRNPETGAKSWKVRKGVSAKEIVRLFEAGAHVEMSAITASRKELGETEVKITRSGAVQTAQGAPIPQVIIQIPSNGRESRD